MDMLYIVVLVLFGLLFLVAEIVLLPGLSFGALLSLVCYGTAVYLGFHDYGVPTGIGVIAAIVVLSVAGTVFSLRAKTWQRFSLHQKITSSSTPTPAEQHIGIGDEGKSPDAYVDPKTMVEVVDFENSNVVVKVVK